MGLLDRLFKPKKHTEDELFLSQLKRPAQIQTEDELFLSQWKRPAQIQEAIQLAQGGHPERALEALRRILEEARASQDSLSVGLSLSGMARTHTIMKQYDEAIKHYEEARAVMYESGEAEFTQMIHSNINELKRLRDNR